MTFYYFLLIIGVIMLFILYRNNKVLEFRLRVIDRVFRDANYMKREKIFRSVSYYEMLFKFWKPLKSFYKGTELEEK